MSRLDKLIAELCPDGVVYLTVEEIFNVKNGYTPSKNVAEYWANGTVPWFRMEDIRKQGNILEEAIQHISSEAVKGGRLFPANSIIMSTTATIGEHALVKVDCLTNQQMTNLSIKNEHKKSIDIKFIFYVCFNLGEWCKKNVNKGGGLPIINAGKLKKYKIPIPPLPVQQEIVRILDNFTELTAELTAELEARKKQYEYYRNELFNFNNRTDIKYISVGELFEFKNGLNKGKEYFGKGTPIVNFTDVYKNRYLTADMLKGKVEVTENEIMRNSAKKGDVFFTRTSETKEEIGMASVLIDDVEDCVFSGFVLRARPITDLLLPKYCSYCFSSYLSRKEIIRRSTFTTRALTSGPRLSKLIIPIPSLEEQRRIVSILDRFNILVNDMSQGLPAEIEARKKQYEYYRDKLLTFKEKAI